MGSISIFTDLKPKYERETFQGTKFCVFCYGVFLTLEEGVDLKK